MKVFRFMSDEEFKKFKEDKTLINYKKHNCNTTSIGFCFLSLDDFKPEYAIHFLNGLVNTEVCAIFEVDKKKLNKSKGKYAQVILQSDWRKMSIIEQYASFTKSFDAREYCTEKYNNKNFKLLRYTKDSHNYFGEDYPKWSWKDENL